MENVKLEFSKLSICDNSSRVFEMNGRFYRGIKNTNEDFIKLTDSELFHELSAKNLIPSFSKYDKELPLDYGVVLEMETANYISYPHQWSFDMLKDACLLYLEVFTIALKYGYILKDGHPYNIVFFNNCPKFVDLGSFVRSVKVNLTEFNKTMFYPLLIWSHGYSKMAQTFLRDDNSIATYKDVRSTFFGIILLQDSKKKALNDILNFLVNKSPINSSKDILGKIQFIKEKIDMPKYKTRWNKYHDDYIENMENPTIRFSKVVELINSFTDVESVFDIACNKGYLSMLIEKSCPKVKKIIASDYDDNAINDAYLCIKNKQFNKISISKDDIMRPTQNYQEKEISKRFKSDCVIVLALTHHLLLTQHYNMDVISETLANYTNKYLLIEFMPMGLWGGGSHKAPETPDYYNEDWFYNGLANHFIIHEKLELETNRILFVCTKK